MALFTVEELREYIRSAVDDSDSPDPSDVTKLVVDKISNSNLRTALAIVLPSYIQMVTRGKDRGSRQQVPNRNTRAAGIRQWALTLLSSHVYVGTEWKFMRDCTADDLQNAAAERYKLAHSAKVEGDRFTFIAAELRKRKVHVVGDLTETQLHSIFSSSGAMTP